MIPTQRFSKRLANDSVQFGLSTKKLIFASVIPSVLNLFGVPEWIAGISFGGSILVLILGQKLLGKGQIERAFTKKDFFVVEKVRIKK